MKRTLCMLLCLLLLAACVPAAPQTDGGVEQTPPPAPPIPSQGVSRLATPGVQGDVREIKWFIPVLLSEREYLAAIDRVADVCARANDRLAMLGKKLSISIKLQRVAYVALNGALDKPPTYFGYWLFNDMRLALTSDVWYDLISIPAGVVTIPHLIDRGFLKEISTEIPKYEHLRAAIDADMLEATRYNSGLHGIPAGYAIERDLYQNYLAVPKKMLEAIKLDSFTGIEGLMDAAARAGLNALPRDVYFQNSPAAYRRTYPQYPFHVSEDNLFLFDQDGNVHKYIDSEVFMQDRMVSETIWNSLSEPAKAGDWDKIDILAQSLHRLSGNFDDYLPVDLAPDAPQILRYSPYGKIYNAIPAKCDEPYALELLDCIYSDKALYEIFHDETNLYGSHGFDLDELTPKNNIMKLYEPYLSDSDERRADIERMIEFRHSLFDCVKQTAMSGYTHEASESMRAVYSRDGFEPMPWDGFEYDPKVLRVPGKDEVYVGPASVAQSLDFVICGRLSYESIADIRRELDEYGYERAFEECKSQYAAFLAGKERR